MVINRPGAKFNYAGTTYTVGGKVVANCQSEYEGLMGTIFEIRDGTDKETDNDGPDLYCAFSLPAVSAVTAHSEKRFSKVYGRKMRIADIALDYVIMAPDMLYPLSEEDAEKVYYNRLLHKKAQVEFDEYTRNLHTMSGKDAAKHSYETVIKEDMVSCLEDVDLEYEEAVTLYLMEYPLDYLYREWLKNDFSIMDMLRCTIDDGAKYALAE